MESLTSISSITASRFYQNSTNTIRRFGELGFSMKMIWNTRCAFQFPYTFYLSTTTSKFITFIVYIEKPSWKTYWKAHISIHVMFEIVYLYISIFSIFIKIFRFNPPFIPIIHKDYKIGTIYLKILTIIFTVAEIVI